MGFFTSSASSKAALRARHAAKLAEMRANFEAEAAKRAEEERVAEATREAQLALLRENVILDALTDADRDALCGLMRRVEVRVGHRVCVKAPPGEGGLAAKVSRRFDGLFGRNKNKNRDGTPPAETSSVSSPGDPGVDDADPESEGVVGDEESDEEREKLDPNDAMYVLASGAVDFHVRRGGDAAGSSGDPRRSDGSSLVVTLDRPGDVFGGAVCDALFAISPDARTEAIAADARGRRWVDETGRRNESGAEPKTLFADENQINRDQDRDQNQSGEREEDSRVKGKKTLSNSDPKGSSPPPDSDSSGLVVLWAIPAAPLRKKRGFAALMRSALEHRVAWDGLLANVPLLASSLSETRRAFLVARLVRETHAPFAPLAVEGEVATRCVMLAAGEAHAMAALVGGRGDEELWRGALRPGDAVGAFALVPFRVVSDESVRRDESVLRDESGRRAFAVAPRLTFEATVRAGDDGAETASVAADAFHDLFRRCSDPRTREGEATRDDDDAPLLEAAAPFAHAARLWADAARDNAEGVVGVVGEADADATAGVGPARPRTPRTPSPPPRARGSAEGALVRVHEGEEDPRDDDDDDVFRRENRPPLVALPRRYPRRAAPAPETRLERPPRGREGEWETDSEDERERRDDPDAATPRESEDEDDAGAFATGRASSRPDDDDDARDDDDDESSASLGGALGGASGSGSRVVRKLYRRKPPLGPPPSGRSRLRRLLACLESFALFEGVERRVLVDAVANLERDIVAPGGALYRAGDEAEYLYVLEAGEIDVETPEYTSGGDGVLGVGASGGSGPSPSRRESTRLASGAVFGDVALTHAPARREATARARQRGAKLWGMRKRWFERLNAPAVRARRALVSRFVADVPLLAGLPSAETFAAAERMREATFAPGDVVIAQGERAEAFYVVYEGAARATVRLPGEPEPAEVARFARGSYFGELEMLMSAGSFFEDGAGAGAGAGGGAEVMKRRERPRVATVTAYSALRCAAIDRADFERLAREGTELRARLVRECRTYVSGLYAF